ncbi:MAG: hypothetical protein Q8916_00850 [Bacteroidota bacterium]|nr:hypothetical protein [Bacteroidota bacterium]MDP4228934.1 hypothetical protein [Bacteroidota bacterium]MDP4236701.1 hypothetical protein [Bacteroidota bacterium]
MGNQQATVIFGNLKHAELGTVEMTFDDGYVVMKEIHSLGHTVFDSSWKRKPISLRILDETFLLSELPKDITFPDGESGTIYNFSFDGGPTIIMSDVY